MAPPANWNGYLRLSLVFCPIALSNDQRKSPADGRGFSELYMHVSTINPRSFQTSETGARFDLGAIF
jgi:hypothetical protein